MSYASFDLDSPSRRVASFDLEDSLRTDSSEDLNFSSSMHVGDRQVRVTPLGATPMSTETAKAVRVFNEYRPGKARYYELTEKQAEQLTADYNKIKGKLCPEGATHFIVNFSKQTVSYELNGIKYFQYLDDNDAYKAALHSEGIIAKEIYHAPVHSGSFISGEKGSSTGKPALIRQDGSVPAFDMSQAAQIIEELPNEQRAVAGERISRAQKKLEERQNYYAAAIVDADGDEKELKRLNAELAAWNRVDAFALYSAIAHLPENLDDVPQAARALKAHLAPQMGESFAIDVGGLMFAARGAQGRHEYGQYCRDMGISMKRDGIEDQLLREVVQEEARLPLSQQFVDGSGSEDESVLFLPSISGGESDFEDPF